MHKKILLLTTPFKPNVGGVETHLDDLIKEGVELGFKFDVLTYQPLVTESKGQYVEKGKGLTVYRLPWIRNNLFLRLEKYPSLEFLYLFPGLFFLGFFYLLFNFQKIKIIHAQGLAAGAVGFSLGKIFLKPVIISIHSIYNFPKTGPYPSFVRFMMSNCKKVLTLSKQSRKEIIKLGVSFKKVSVFRYWVDQKTFSPSDKLLARRRLGLPEGPFTALFVGRLVAVKGVKELLEAAKYLSKDAIFLVVGDGPLSGFVTKVAKKHKNVIFAGRLENNKLPDYYNAANVLIVPSIHEEGYGRVILESLSCGTPVIASKRGGILEAVDSSVAILLDITPQNIKNAVKELNEDNDRLASMSKNARKFAEKYFDKKNVYMITKYY